jgi:hypothetical protein
MTIPADVSFPLKARATVSTRYHKLWTRTFVNYFQCLGLSSSIMALGKYGLYITSYKRWMDKAVLIPDV